MKDAQSDSCSVYVGDLAPSTSQGDLQRLFGTLGSCVVKLCSTANSDKSGRLPSKYAYVTYGTPNEAAAAIRQYNHYQLHGRCMRVMLRVKTPLSKRDGAGNLFVRGLHPSVDNRVLEQAFGMFGKVLSAKVVVDEQGQSRGYGFCQFEDPLAADAAIAALHGSSTLGSPLVVSHFRRKKPEPGSDRPAVVVRGLPPDMTSPEVKELFSTAGTIKRVRIVLDEEGCSRGVAFVTFTEPSSIKGAIDAFHDYSIGPHRLSIAPAQRQPQLQPGGREAGSSSGAASIAGGEDGSVRGSGSAAQQLSHVAAAGAPGPLGAAAGAAELAPAQLMYAAQYSGGSVPLGLAQPYMAAAAAQQQQFLAAAQLGGQPAAAVAAALYSGARAAPSAAPFSLGSGGLPPPSAYGSLAAAAGLASAAPEEHSRDTLYVRPLPESLDEAGLREIFQHYGTVVATKILRTPDGASRGAGFVEFASHDQAAAALAVADGVPVADPARPLRVAWALRRRASSDLLPGPLAAGAGLAPGSGSGGMGGAGAAAAAGVLLSGGGLLPAQHAAVLPMLQPMLMGAMPFFVVPQAGYAPLGGALPLGAVSGAAQLAPGPPLGDPAGAAGYRGAASGTPRGAAAPGRVRGCSSWDSAIVAAAAASAAAAATSSACAVSPQPAGQQLSPAGEGELADRPPTPGEREVAALPGSMASLSIADGGSGHSVGPAQQGAAAATAPGQQQQQQQQQRRALANASAGAPPAEPSLVPQP